MLILALVGGFCAAFFEIRLAISIPWVKTMATKSKLFGLMLSLVISQVLGMMFAVVGVTSMLIFIVSTVFTQFVYSYWSVKDKISSHRNSTRKVVAA